MRKDGSQEFMFNQYDNSTHFYKMVSVERELRRLARENRNLYVVSTFACVNLKSIKEDCLPAVPKEIFSEEQSESQELTKEIITSDQNYIFIRCDGLERQPILKSLLDIFKNFYDQSTGNLELPQILDELRAKHETVELDISPNQLPLKLQYKTITSSIGVVFVNTHCKSRYKRMIGTPAGDQKIEELYVMEEMMQKGVSKA